MGGAVDLHTHTIASDGALNDNFGRAVAIDGDTIVVGAPSNSEAGGEAGAAYVFERSGVAWPQVAKLFVIEDGADDLEVEVEEGG